MSSEIDEALENLNAIKDGDDPLADSQSEPDDALSAVKQEVNRLYDEHDVLQENLERENLHVGVAEWKGRNGVCKYNRRLKKQRFGSRMTKQPREEGHHVVVINKKIYDEGNVDEFIDTVRHEVAHALAFAKHGGNQKHNHNWKRLCIELGADPTSRHSKRDRSDEYEYYIGCPNCGMKSGKTKRSKTIKQPFHRKCKKCGESSLVSFDAGDEMPDENGVVAVKSLPWDDKDEFYDHKF